MHPGFEIKVQFNVRQLAGYIKPHIGLTFGQGVCRYPRHYFCLSMQTCCSLRLVRTNLQTEGLLVTTCAYKAGKEPMA